MKKIILLGICIILLVGSITALSISKEIDIETNQKTALSNIGIDDITIKHNCETGKGSCKALLYKQTSEEVIDEEGNLTIIYKTVLNKEIEIDTSKQFCIKEGLNKEFDEMVCVEYRGLNQEELNEKIRKASEDKLKWISDVLINRENRQAEILNNQMEIIIK